MVKWLWILAVALALRLETSSGFSEAIVAFATTSAPPRRAALTPECRQFRGRTIQQRRSALLLSSTASDVSSELKHELFELSRLSSRGFKASAGQRARAKEILEVLSRLNPTPDPARDYYPKLSGSVDRSSSSSSSLPSLCGKWTPLYTDAPDIVGLQAAPNVLADLGRIGQHCDPPLIKNVIEWKPPRWATDLSSALLPSGGGGSRDLDSFVSTLPSRILQQVVTKARASPDEPLRVKLDAAGLQVSFDEGTKGPSEARDEKETTRRSRGLLGAYLPNSILDVQGPLTVPFGEFRVLYLDDDFRATRTFQGYVAVNERIKSEDDAWF